MPSPHKLRRIAAAVVAIVVIIALLIWGDIDLYPQGHST